MCQYEMESDRKDLKYLKKEKKKLANDSYKMLATKIIFYEMHGFV